MSTNVRSFIAININEEVRSYLGELCDKIGLFDDNAVRWTNPNNIHLTIKFLGDIEKKTLSPVCNSIRDALGKEKSFDIYLTRTGVFPNIRRPRILWVGLDLNSELFELQKLINIHLKDLDFQEQNKRFHPHLTIGRVKRIPPSDVFMRKFLQYDIIKLKIAVTKLHLMASTLTPRGPIYSVIRSFDLDNV